MKLEAGNGKDSHKLLSLSREQMRCYFEENSLEWNVEERTEFLNESQVYRILDPKFCGYLQLCTKGSELFIYDLQITANNRGRGVGTKVVNQVCAMAKAQGLVAVRLGSFKSNPASQLYKRMGFVPIKENSYFIWYRYAIT